MSAAYPSSLGTERGRPDARVDAIDACTTSDPSTDRANARVRAFIH